MSPDTVLETDTTPSTVALALVNKIGHHYVLTWDGKDWILTTATGRVVPWLVAQSHINDNPLVVAGSPNSPYLVKYTNYRGETGVRFIQPVMLWWGSTTGHPEPQWFLTSIDKERNVSRDFALKDFHEFEESTSALPQ